MSPEELKSQFLEELSQAARAHGLTRVTMQTGISTSHLYQQLTKGKGRGNLTLDSITKIAAAAGYRVKLEKESA